MPAVECFQFEAVCHEKSGAHFVEKRVENEIIKDEMFCAAKRRE